MELKWDRKNNYLFRLRKITAVKLIAKDYKPPKSNEMEIYNSRDVAYVERDSQIGNKEEVFENRWI